VPAIGGIRRFEAAKSKQTADFTSKCKQMLCIPIGRCAAWAGDCIKLLANGLVLCAEELVSWFEGLCKDKSSGCSSESTKFHNYMFFFMLGNKEKLVN